jgi:hypothetical protein
MEERMSERTPADKASSKDIAPQADQRASTETAERAGQQGDQAKVLNEQAKEQAKEGKD